MENATSSMSLELSKDGADATTMSVLSELTDNNPPPENSAESAEWIPVCVGEILGAAAADKSNESQSAKNPSDRKITTPSRNDKRPVSRGRSRNPPTTEESSNGKLTAPKRTVSPHGSPKRGSTQGSIQNQNQKEEKNSRETRMSGTPIKNRPSKPVDLTHQYNKAMQYHNRRKEYEKLIPEECTFAPNMEATVHHYHQTFDEEEPASKRLYADAFAKPSRMKELTASVSMEEGCTFKPQLVSRPMSPMRKQKSSDEPKQLKENSDSSNINTSLNESQDTATGEFKKPTSRPSTPSRFQQLYQNAKETKEKLEAKRKSLENVDIVDCTFKPTIVTTTHKTPVKSSSPENTEETKEKDSPRYNKLYADHIEREERMKQRAKMLEDQRQAELLRESQAMLTLRGLKHSQSVPYKGPSKTYSIESTFEERMKESDNKLSEKIKALKDEALLRDSKECTFKPTLKARPQSAGIRRKNSGQLGEEKESNQKPIYDRLLESAKELKLKKEALKEKVEAERNSENSFKPKLISKPSMSSATVEDESPGEGSAPVTPRKPVHLRLVDVASEYKSKKELLKERYLEEQSRELTFSPKLVTDPSKFFKRSVSRAGGSVEGDQENIFDRLNSEAKWKLFLEEKRQREAKKEFTFTPTLNQRAKSAPRRRSIEESSIKVEDRLILAGIRRKSVLEQFEKTKAESELEGCTFAPSIPDYNLPAYLKDPAESLNDNATQSSRPVSERRKSILALTQTVNHVPHFAAPTLASHFHHQEEEKPTQHVVSELGDKLPHFAAPTTASKSKVTQAVGEHVDPLDVAIPPQRRSSLISTQEETKPIIPELTPGKLPSFLAPTEASKSKVSQPVELVDPLDVGAHSPQRRASMTSRPTTPSANRRRSQVDTSTIKTSNTTETGRTEQSNSVTESTADASTKSALVDTTAKELFTKEPEETTQLPVEVPPSQVQEELAESSEPRIQFPPTKSIEILAASISPKEEPHASNHEQLVTTQHEPDNKTIEITTENSDILMSNIEPKKLQQEVRVIVPDLPKPPPIVTTNPPIPPTVENRERDTQSTIKKEKSKSDTSENSRVKKEEHKTIGTKQLVEVPDDKKKVTEKKKVQDPENHWTPEKPSGTIWVKKNLSSKNMKETDNNDLTPPQPQSQPEVASHVESSSSHEGDLISPKSTSSVQPIIQSQKEDVIVPSNEATIDTTNNVSNPPPQQENHNKQQTVATEPNGVAADHAAHISPLPPPALTIVIEDVSSNNHVDYNTQNMSPQPQTISNENAIESKEAIPPKLKSESTSKSERTRVVKPATPTGTNPYTSGELEGPSPTDRANAAIASLKSMLSANRSQSFVMHTQQKNSPKASPSPKKPLLSSLSGVFDEIIEDGSTEGNGSKGEDH